MNAFQWLVAYRYLKLETARSRKIHGITLGLLLLFMVGTGLSYLLEHAHSIRMQELRADWHAPLQNLKLVVLVLLVLVAAFIALVRRLTIFTTISTYGLFIGSGALVIVLSVMSGFEHDLRHKILGANAHIVVTTPDRAFVDFAAVQKKLAALPSIIGVSPFLTNEVMISSQSNLSGVVVKGIDPATVGQVTDLERNIDVGSLQYLADPDKLRALGGPPILKHEDDDFDAPPGARHFKPADKHGLPAPEPEKPSEIRRVVPGVIIGRELAKNLRLYVGDDVNIVSPLGGIGPQGPIPKSKPFRVAGIFFSGMFEYDSKYIYLAIPAAQKFLGLEDEVTGIELKVTDADQTAAPVAAIERALGAGYEVQSWQELNRNLFSALKLEKIAMFIVLCFIILVAAFSIIANGIMLVMEKGREIAILKSMGASDRAILVVFLLLGLYMGSVGTLGGIGVGVLACLALARWGLPLDPDVYYITQLPVTMNPREIVTVFAAAVCIALLATMYPAWVAARLRPVDGLREGNH